MKTNKVHPLTAFRKFTEARQTKVKKSLKKAQDGIQTNDDSNMMINKPGSTGGYKSSSPWANSNSAAYKSLIDRVAQSPYNISEANLTNSMIENASRANERARINNAPGPKSATSGAADLYFDKNREQRKNALNNIKQKKGGAVKRKK